MAGEFWTPQLKIFWQRLGPRLKLPAEPTLWLEEPAEPLPLEAPVVSALRRLLGDDVVSTEPRILQQYGGGQTYAGFVRRAVASPHLFPRAVVFPPDEQALASLMVWAGERDLALLPWGSGLHPYRGKSITKPFLIVDMDRMDRIYPIDTGRREVRVQGGGRWIEVDRRLSPLGLTLGYRHALANPSIGGRVANGGCNLLPLRYGPLRDLLSTVRMLTPQGPIQAGNSSDVHKGLLSLVVGQQGRWGIITEVNLHLYPVSGARLFVRAEFPDWQRAMATAQQIVSSSVPLLFLLGWPTVLDLLMRRGEERSVLPRLRKRRPLEGERSIVLWMAVDGEPEMLNAARKVLTGIIQERGGSLTTWKDSPTAHPIGDHFMARVGQCRICVQEMWRRGLLAMVVEHPAEWDNAAEALFDWEESMNSVLQSSGGGGALIASILFARRDDVRFHSLLLGRQSAGGPAAWKEQLEMIYSVSDAAVRRWQAGSYTRLLDDRLAAALTASLDPDGVMVR